MYNCKGVFAEVLPNMMFVQLSMGEQAKIVRWQGECKREASQRQGTIPKQKQKIEDNEQRQNMKDDERPER